MSLRYYDSVSIGCDPEFFFRKKDGTILEAQDVLPDEGLEYVRNTDNRDGGYTSLGSTNSKFVIDGLQAELNPRPNTCRANLGNEVHAMFKTLSEHIEGKDVKVDFGQIVKLSKDDMNRISNRSKQFGCMPSYNVYDQDARIGVDPSKYPYRSAGGHIHLGSTDADVKEVLKDHERIVPMLDIILGNTCVLIDRDTGNKERRKVYGRAGEYRKPAYGIEYRTLSNFWLRRYQLMSMVTGFARLAVMIVHQGYENDIRSLVDIEKVRVAINRNNKRLAMSNWKAIEQKLVKLCGAAGVYNGYPLDTKNIKYFNHFIKKGLKYWFKKNDMKHWTTLKEGHDHGFESFLSGYVRKDMEK